MRYVLKMDDASFFYSYYDTCVQQFTTVSMFSGVKKHYKLCATENPKEKALQEKTHTQTRRKVFSHNLPKHALHTYKKLPRQKKGPFVSN